MKLINNIHVKPSQNMACGNGIHVSFGHTIGKDNMKNSGMTQKN